MPLIFGAFLAGALLSCLVPISLLIAFATFFYRQASRMPSNKAADAPVETPVDPPAAPGQPYPQS